MLLVSLMALPQEPKTKTVTFELGLFVADPDDLNESAGRSDLLTADFNPSTGAISIDGQQCDIRTTT